MLEDLEKDFIYLLSSLYLFYVAIDFLLLFFKYVSWLSLCLLELQGRMNQWTTSLFSLEYMNDLISIECLVVLYMFDHYIWCFSQNIHNEDWGILVEMQLNSLKG